MFGLFKIMMGCVLMGVALVLCFTIIGILFAGPVFAASFACFTAGFAELGFKTVKAAQRLSK